MRGQNSHHRTKRSLKAAASIAALLGFLLPQAASGQDTPSDSIAINVLRALVAKGVLTKKDAQAIIKQAEADAAGAHAQRPSAASQAQQAPAPQQASAAATPASNAEAGSVLRVPYIAPNVQEDIEKKVKAQVLAEEEQKDWAKPGIFPDWVNRFTPFADFRFRDESHYFDKNNFYGFVNGATFNSSGPFDINSGAFPILNSLQNRNILQIRARLGFNFQVNDEITTTFMAASGNNNGPISTTQDLGSDFDKKNLWLDQAYMMWNDILPWTSLTVGRFPNPFRSVEVLFKQDDFQLDGAAFQIKGEVGDFKPFLTAGGFPIQFSTDDFPTTAPATLKTSDKEKWLIGGQTGFDWAATNRLTESFSVGFYDYLNLQNEPSSCQYTDFYCFANDSHPNYMQKGNTLLFLMPNDTNPTTGASPQYLGLASKFEDIDLLEKLDYQISRHDHVILIGDYVRNLAFDENQILKNARGIDGLATNNETCVLPAGVSLAPGQSCTAAGGHNVFRSGNTAWLARIVVGQPVMHERWDWSLSGSYLYIEPDAVVDAFDDKDFRLGGTNSKGFILEGDLGLAHNTWLTIKYLSADQIDGPPFSVDNLQLDLNTRF